MHDYHATPLRATIDTAAFIHRFHNAPRFEQCCRECPCYGARWGCPPHDRDWLATLRQFGHVLIAGTKITPVGHDIPLSEAHNLMRPELHKLNSFLLDMERHTAGMALGFAGKCELCGDEPCTRRGGHPCRHPELVRPSLESVGFDVDATCRELLHEELLWGRDGHLPPHLIIVGALFHQTSNFPENPDQTINL